MENLGLPGDDSVSEFDFHRPFDESSPDAASLLDAGDVDASPPGSLSWWIGEIEGMLMEDEDEEAVAAAAVGPSPEVFDRFFADLLVDSPEGGPAEVAVTDGASDKESSSPGGGGGERGEKAVAGDNELSEDADGDPVSKKRRRQLRNKDSAARSRERKRTYVKELEMKSKYLEGECRRLGRLLQCFVAENQALRLNVENGGAYGATMAMQESAVLLLESLLLGSLLWFLGIVCLFTRPVSLPIAAGGTAAGKRRRERSEKSGSRRNKRSRF
ncbi:hypothetical protein NL676_027527 [Syzygium grande]|nr:hypothetical protein NL676_027527 [Syzygium grande]